MKGDEDILYEVDVGVGSLAQSLIEKLGVTYFYHRGTEGTEDHGGIPTWPLL